MLLTADLYLWAVELLEWFLLFLLDSMKLDFWHSSSERLKLPKLFAFEVLSFSLLLVKFAKKISVLEFNFCQLFIFSGQFFENFFLVPIN